MALDPAITSLSWNKELRVPPRLSLLAQLALYIPPLLRLHSQISTLCNRVQPLSRRLGTLRSRFFARPTRTTLTNNPSDTLRAKATVKACRSSFHRDPRQYVFAFKFVSEHLQPETKARD